MFHHFSEAADNGEIKHRSIRSFSIIEKLKEFFSWPLTAFDAVPNERRPRVNWRKNRWGPYIDRKEGSYSNSDRVQMSDSEDDDYDDYYSDDDGNNNRLNPYRRNPMERPRPTYPPGFWNKWNWNGFISRKTETKPRNPSIPFV